MHATDYFRSIPLFSDLSEQEVIDVLRLAKVVTFSAGDYLCRKGEQADCMFVVESGDLSVEVPTKARDSVEITKLGAGAIIGELALVAGEPRSADVVAGSDVQAYRVDRTEFDNMRLDLHPAAFKMLRRIAVTVCGRLRDINTAVAGEVGGQDSVRKSERPPLWRRVLGRFSGEADE
jgi:CRP-like cAMP-binding protein